MAHVSIHTLLSLDRFAKLLGINPVHFHGADAGYAASGEQLFPYTAKCSSRWYQHAWQSADQTSREEIASAILDAENEISALLGFYPAPMWIMNEPRLYPRHHNTDYENDTYDARGRLKGLRLKYGKFIQAGTRAVTLIATPTIAGATITFWDSDGDGFSEIVRITAATSISDACELKVFVPGYNGAQEWEIRDPIRKSTAAGFVTFYFYKWQLINPIHFETFPTDGALLLIGLVDIALVTTKLLTSVEVYREYTDTTQPSAVFYWEPQCDTTSCSYCGGTGCVACSHTTQNGCIYVRDIENSVVVPQPATYSAITGTWASDEWAVCSRPPDIVKAHYYAGELNSSYLRSNTCELLSDYYAKAIIWLTLARLDRPFCSCGNVNALQRDMQLDLTLSSSSGPNWYVTPDVMGCPLGTKKGEVMAWRRIGKFGKRHINVAVI